MNGFARRLGAGVLTLLFFALSAEANAATAAIQLAQNTVPPRAVPKGSPAAPAPKAEPPAAAAQAPPAQPMPTRTEIQHFESWTVTCNEFTEGSHTRSCAAVLQILQQDTNQTVFAWTIGMDNAKQMVTILQTPTGVAIAPGVELRVGKSAARKISFASCDPGRCIATIPMDAALVRELTAAPTVEAVIQGSQGNTVQFTIQMKGFDKAIAALSKP